MDDLISRQAAIDEVQRHRENVLGGYEYDEGVAFVYAAAHNHIIEVIKCIPSANTDMSGYSDKLWHLAHERGIREAQQQWIPCSERLPDKNGKYLVVGRQKAINILKFDGGRWYGKWGVVAWMPIPEPCKGDEDDSD